MRLDKRWSPMSVHTCGLLIGGRLSEWGWPGVFLGVHLVS